MTIHCVRCSVLVYHEGSEAGCVIGGFQSTSDGVDKFQIFAGTVLDAILLCSEHDSIGSHAAVYVIERL